jgi:outer membrane protein OmpA-like peptidoglycan-associated protein
LGNASNLASAASSAAHAAAHEAKEAGTNWLLPVLLGLGLLAGLWWFMNRTAEPAASVATEVKEAAKDAGTAVADAAKSMWAALGEFFKRKLPNGVEIEIPRLGVENRLIEFIEAKDKAVDKTTWFDFDRLLFDTGSATLQAASQDQLGDLAEILKAFPAVNLKIGGYTDNTGDKAANMKLSQARADSVKAELVKLGVAASRLDAEGYGDAHPVGDNATEEGRQKNRRISMRVTAK